MDDKEWEESRKLSQDKMAAFNTGMMIVKDNTTIVGTCSTVYSSIDSGVLISKRKGMHCYTGSSVYQHEGYSNVYYRSSGTNLVHLNMCHLSHLLGVPSCQW